MYADTIIAQFVLDDKTLTEPFTHTLCSLRPQMHLSDAIMFLSHENVDACFRVGISDDLYMKKLHSAEGSFVATPDFLSWIGSELQKIGVLFEFVGISV